MSTTFIEIPGVQARPGGRVRMAEGFGLLLGDRLDKDPNHRC